MADTWLSCPENLIFQRGMPIVFNGKVAVEYWRTADFPKGHCNSLMLFMSNYVTGEQPGKG
jgi:hypothetical protein